LKTHHAQSQPTEALRSPDKHKLVHFKQTPADREVEARQAQETSGGASNGVKTTAPQAQPLQKKASVPNFSNRNLARTKQKSPTRFSRAAPSTQQTMGGMLTHLEKRQLVQSRQNIAINDAEKESKPSLQAQGCNPVNLGTQ